MDGRVALVTGGVRGIGAAIADRLAHDGVAVATLDVLEAATARPGILELRCDLGDAAQVERAVAEITEVLGPPGIVVHCAAYQTVAPFERLDPADWQRTFRVNVDGAFHVLRAALPAMRAAGWGRVVLITSSTLWAPPPTMVHYVASKGALTGMVRALSVEVGADGVTVNAVAPGLTRTENSVRTLPESHFDLVRTRQAVPRSGEPADIAGAVAYLVSDDAGFVTGQTLLIDGGESHL